MQELAAFLVTQPSCESRLTESDQFSKIQGESSHRPISSGRCQSSPIRAEGDAKDIAQIAVEGENLLARGDIPNFGQPVKAGRSEARAIFIKSQAMQQPGMARHRPQLLAGSHIPQRNGAVLVAHRQHFAHPG